MPHKDQSKEQAFALWKSGKGLSDIQARSTAEPGSVKMWIREWERGKQGVWDPPIR